MNKYADAAAIALRAIWGSKLRSLMTVLGNIVAVTSIVAVVSLIQGLNASVRDAILNQAGADSFIVQQFGIVRSDEEWLRVQSNPIITKADAEAVRRHSPLVAAVMLGSQARARVSYRSASINDMQIRGVTQEYVNFSNYDAERGRLMTSTEVNLERPVVVLGAQLAERLFGPDVDPLDKIIQIGGVHYRVVGVSAVRGTLLGQSQDEFAVIPLGQFQQLFGSRRQLTMSVKPRDLSQIGAAIDDTTIALRIGRRLRPGDPDNFAIFNSETVLGIYRAATTGIFAVLVGVVALSLVVGGIVIMNIMLMVVSERTREIGLRKALGARRADIMTQILSESIVLSVFGGVIGTILGWLIATVISELTPIPASIQPWSVALGITITALVGLFFGLYPASRAARLDPIEALEARMKPPRIRYGLMREVIVMAVDTVRTNKMRSGLTVLGVVIGITAIVAMTALIRGFDSSLQESIRTSMGPNTIFIQRFGITSFASGREFSELIRRPILTVSDARALEQATTLQYVDIEMGVGPGPPIQRRIAYRNQRTRPILVFGTTEFFAEGTRIPIVVGRFLSGVEIQYRSNVVVLGHNAYQLLFEQEGIDPIGKVVRIGSDQFTVVGVFGKRPSPGNFEVNQDDFAVIPYSTFQRVYGLRLVDGFRGAMMTPVQISVVPRSGVTQEEALEEVERIMRIRHGLRLDEPNDFDLVTQNAVVRLWNQVSQATFLALVVISSIALMVGGIGVMAIMSISVTERTREIGVRRALGARRREVLYQFLTEAAVLTSVGGVLGVLLGSIIGYGVHFLTGFPVSLPFWSFALGLGFSAVVGIGFGMYPAIRAARLDPIEALRYE